MVKKKIAFLCSGGGGNLRFVRLAIGADLLPDFVLAAVIADRECDAIPYANAHGISSHLIAYTRKSPEQLTTLLDEIKPDIIVTNIHKILDSAIVQRWGSRMVNLHYSLLPAFKGLIGAEPVRQALALGCKVIGSTAHHVAEEVDAGGIIAQSAIFVNPEQPFEAVMDAVFRGGCITLANAIQILVSLKGARDAPHAIFEGQYFAPAPTFAFDALTPAFWASVRETTYNPAIKQRIV